MTVAVAGDDIMKLLNFKVWIGRCAKTHEFPKFVPRSPLSTNAKLRELKMGTQMNVLRSAMKDPTLVGNWP